MIPSSPPPRGASWNARVRFYSETRTKSKITVEKGARASAIPDDRLRIERTATLSILYRKLAFSSPFGRERESSLSFFSPASPAKPPSLASVSFPAKTPRLPHLRIRANDWPAVAFSPAIDRSSSLRGARRFLRPTSRTNEDVRTARIRNKTRQTKRSATLLYSVDNERGRLSLPPSPSCSLASEWNRDEPRTH